jgi:hypothetical protein
VIAEITHENAYANLILAFRARANERRIAITGEDVARVAGMANFYLAKVLSPSSNPAKRFGAASLGPILAVLGLKLLLVEDAQAVKIYGTRIPPRASSFAHSTAFTQIRSRQFMRKIGKKGAQVRWDNKRKRHAAASKAARIRWATGGKANGAAAREG